MFEKIDDCKFIWRIINGMGCLFFLCAAFVNLNDNDWYLWVTIYVCTSIFLAIECLNYQSLSIVFVYLNALVFCLLISFGCQFLLKYQHENPTNFSLKHEEARELSGLALASSWLLLILLNRLMNFNYHLSLLIISFGAVLTLIPVGMWSVCYMSDEWRERFPQCQMMIASKEQSHFRPTF